MIGLKALSSRLTPVVRRNHHRQLWDWVASHPDVAGLSVAVALSLARIYQLQVKIREQIVAAEHQSRREQELRQGKMNLEDELCKTRDREKQYEQKALSLAAAAQQQEKREEELRIGKEKADSDLREAVKREARLQASITDRGQMAERGLEHLLAEVVKAGYAKNYRLQAEVVPGKRPDALVEVVGGKYVVVDCKAPQTPTELLENVGDERLRQDYVETLKRHITDLANKRYHSAEGCLPRTWMYLPGEGYLQAAYGADGCDSMGLHAHAVARHVVLVGPNGLRSTLQLVTMWQEEAAAALRLQKADVQERIVQLQPLWTENVLPHATAMGKELKKVVARFNDFQESITKFDLELRAKAALDLKKARKTSLPQRVMMEEEDEGKSTT